MELWIGGNRGERFSCVGSKNSETVPNLCRTRRLRRRNSVNFSAGLCRTLRGFVYPVRGSGRRRSEFLRRQDQEVHRGRQSQPVLHGSGPRRPLTGEGLAAACVDGGVRDFSVPRLPGCSLSFGRSASGV